MQCRRVHLPRQAGTVLFYTSGSTRDSVKGRRGEAPRSWCPPRGPTAVARRPPGASGPSCEPSLLLFLTHRRPETLLPSPPSALHPHPLGSLFGAGELLRNLSQVRFCDLLTLVSGGSCFPRTYLEKFIDICMYLL